uniref:Sodium/proline symporter n=1 Tax=Candidatus Kentrum eta TaxID=2126337 RepID=A0A450VES1_9GAMM|nr:MAG: sodium/proline symporter [Candidatus Kentron sp. H]VFJ97850.1 MAG: sodium/proline symporter [Candidatus Kentron sp. H]VFK03275.1 MAG: sodium/proline symporter [Candidatus Kentron sp. H]
MDSFVTIFVFFFFISIFLWIGVLATKVSADTDTDYLLGGRSFGKYFVGLSAGATTNSGWIMVGVVGMAYSMGVSAFLMLIATFLGQLTFWTFFPAKVNRISIKRNAQTIPEFLGAAIEAPSGKRIITIIVALITIVFLGAYTAAQFSAAAKTLDVFFGVETFLGVIITAGVVLTYSVTGGIRASIWTDVLQAFVVVFVSIGMLGAVFLSSGGVSEIVSGLERIDPRLTDITAIGLNGWFSVAYMVGFFFLGFGAGISQPHVLVRLLAGRNPEEVKQAKWIFLAYVYSTWAAMILFGMTCRVLIPDISDPEQALPLYAIRNFHPVFAGIVLAGVFSIIASTADSLLLVCSSALARDISPILHRKMSNRYGVRYEQSMTLLVGILTVIITLTISGTVFSVILFAVGAVASSLGPAMLITLTERRTHYIALSMAMLTGLITAILWRMMGYSEIVYEIFPGFITALSVHELVMIGFFSGKR